MVGALFADHPGLGYFPTLCIKEQNGWRAEKTKSFEQGLRFRCICRLGRLSGFRNCFSFSRTDGSRKVFRSMPLQAQHHSAPK